MDRPDVYGPQAYRLTFAEAARRGIICGYKVIISVITSEMVTNELLSRSEVVVNGDAVRARQVANQIALRDAIGKYGASKVFTFHKTVQSAASFVADGSEGVRSHLSEFETFHVNGTMPTARREREMRDFRAAARAVMSNARCLTEGVDVPAVNMVAFLSPRRSRVDIVQATGRAMRRAPGKSVGYVLIPLYVELEAGETVENAVSRTNYDEVWDVLNSLQEQDDILAELIRQIGEEKGRGKGFDDNRFADRIDFGGPRLALETLRVAVTTRCLENLYSSWDEYFGKLLSFRERFGHCNVETAWEEDRSLASWVSAQRMHVKKGMLSEDRIRRLNEIGFDSNWQETKKDETWMQSYRALEEYTRRHGNPNVTRKHHDPQLFNWVWIQRQRQRGKSKDGPLTQKQTELLDNLGFRWDAREEKWDENFEELKEFVAKHGHSEVALEQGKESKLASWVNNQRAQQTAGKLRADRKALLDSEKFEWGAQTFEIKWQEMYERLKQYRAKHGDADVPQRWKEDMKLVRWVVAQRQRRKGQELSPEQIALLDQLNFTWEIHPRGTWEQTLQELVDYKEEHGHCDVPSGDSNGKLARFVNSMRTQRNKGVLPVERITKLEAIGFAWASTSWKTRFDELVRYKTAHGNCNIPPKWPENPKLANWVGNQRLFWKQGKLDPERERVLNEIGFTWAKRTRAD